MSDTKYNVASSAIRLSLKAALKSSKHLAGWKIFLILKTFDFIKTVFVIPFLKSHELKKAHERRVEGRKKQFQWYKEEVSSGVSFLDATKNFWNDNA